MRCDGNGALMLIVLFAFFCLFMVGVVIGLLWVYVWFAIWVVWVLWSVLFSLVLVVVDVCLVFIDNTTFYCLLLDSLLFVFVCFLLWFWLICCLTGAAFALFAFEG